MSQHDYVIDNGPGLAVRTDMNAAFQALATNNSGAIEPAVTYPGQFWLDTTTAPDGRLRMRNQANSGWTVPALGEPYPFAVGDMAMLSRSTGVKRIVFNDKPDGTGTDAASITETGVFQGNTTGVILASAAAGGSVYLKPNGDADNTGMVSIDSAGYVTAAAGFYTSATAGVVLAPTGAGTVYLRPNGAGSTAGQVHVDNVGYVHAASGVYAGTGAAVVLATEVGGTVYLRPNGISGTAGQVTVTQPGKLAVDTVVTGVGDPFSIATAQGTYCRIVATVANVRTWSFGVNPAGDFIVADETGGAIVHTIQKNPFLGHSFSGNLTVTSQGFKPGGGPWGDSSDARIKNVEGDYGIGLDAVKGLRPVVYTFKGNDTSTDPEADKNTQAPFAGSPHFQAATDGKQFVGLVAQEVEQVMPAMVQAVPGWIDGAEVDDMRQLDTTNLIFAVVNAIKELATRVEALEGVPA